MANPGAQSWDEHEPLYNDDPMTRTANPQSLWHSWAKQNLQYNKSPSFGIPFRLDYFRSLSRKVWRIAAIALIVVIVLLAGLRSPHTRRLLPPHWRSSDKSPFSGAFARFPRTSALPPQQRRLTLVGAWNGNSAPGYLRHFFYTTQLNADTLDLLFINRRDTPEAQCMNFEELGIDINWGGNVKVVCIDDNEWRRRHIDFMCSQEYGWNCNSIEYAEVTAEFNNRTDPHNFYWRPFRGYAFRDLFEHPQNPFWAWVDHDMFMGDFRRYPFNVLSQLSFLTGSHIPAEHLFLAGQLTAFNFDDPALGGAWKNFKEMRTPAHFTKYINGKMHQAAEETYWSYGYFRDELDLPGKNLSWGVYPDIHGGDYYRGRYGLRDSPVIYVVSGREVLLVPTWWGRETIEKLLQDERQRRVDDLGNLGWTTGEDGSEYLLDDPTLSGQESRELVKAKLHPSPEQLRPGLAEMVPIVPKCHDTVNLGNANFRQCVPLDRVSKSTDPIYRPSLIRFSDYPSMHALRRWEYDDRPRSYERKLFHHIRILKRENWTAWPDFDITTDHVMRYNMDKIEVWRTGIDRDKTLFYRERGGSKSIG